MAIIPRMNQGDRPSAVSSPTLDNSLANIAGAVGDMSNAALETATAEELAQRKAYATALEEKQKIVDASNAGRVSLEFEGHNYKTLADLETQYANAPEKIPAAYTQAMREKAEAIKAREDINDSVKLLAVKDAESTMSSGLRAAYSLTSKLQTNQVKGNLSNAIINFGNNAIGLSSPEAVNQMVQNFKAKEAKNFEVIYGAQAGDKMREIESNAYYAWAMDYTANHPGEYLAGVGMNKLLKANLSEERFAQMQRAAESSRDGWGKRVRGQLVIDAIRHGSVVAKGLMAGELSADDILKERAKYQKQKQDILEEGPKSTQAQKEERMKLIDHELTTLDAVEELWRAGTPVDLLPNDNLPDEVMSEWTRLFGKDKPGITKPKKLEDLLALKNNVITLMARKNTNTGPGFTMLTNINKALEKSASKVRTKTTFFLNPDTPTELAMDIQEERFKTKAPGASVQERNRALLKFMELKNETEEKLGREITEDEGEQLGHRAFYLSYGKTPPAYSKK